MRRFAQSLRILAVSVVFLVSGLLPYLGGALAQPTTYPLIQKADLIYQGAFRLPSGIFGGSTFYYGGTGCAYNPTNNSLFLVGQNEYMVAEVNIPQIVNSAQLRQLATASVRQPFTDASEGKMATVDTSTVKVGGFMVFGGQLYGTAYSYYDADGTQMLSHYRSSLDLAVKGDVQGMYQVGRLGAGFVSGYMTAIPFEWQSILGGPALTGQCCIPIISRTSFGPATFVFDPNDLGVKNPVPVIPLIYYPQSHPLAQADTTNPYFNLATEIRGIVFPQGTRSVLFFGRQGIGPYCYGTGQDCHDPTDGAKGTHSYPYVYQVWSYDASDLFKVKNGQLQPWDIRPYAIWDFDFPISTENKHIGGAVYDPQTERLFVSQQCVDWFGLDCMPLIHVFTIQNLTSASLPTPTNLRVVPY